MLINFSFKNFKGFRDEQVLSLVASKDKKYTNNVIELDNIKDLNLLRSVVMYGANASGKTTVLDALNFCTRFIRESAKYGPSKKIPVKPFMLDADSKSEPVEFEFAFIQENVRYQYGFVVTRERVLKEWLMSYPKGRVRKLFYREYQESTDKSLYEFGTYFQGEKNKLKELTGPNSLFLSTGAVFNTPQLVKVYKWFIEKLYGVKARDLNSRMFSHFMTDDEYLAKIQELIKFADFGINTIEVTEVRMNFDKELPDDAPSKIVSFTEALRTFIEDAAEVANIELDEDPIVLKVEMVHTIGDTSIPLSLEEESAGTQQYFALSFPILDALLNGHVLFVDELDSSLHPLLVQSIVNLFHNPSINTKGAQLIFNTHDTTLLNLSLFRRDQIWFVEKDQDASSHIYSLLDYSPRKDEALEKGYLQGRYGAIPFLGIVPKEVFQIG